MNAFKGSCTSGKGAIVDTS